MKKLKGSLSIGRTSGGSAISEKHPVRIEVTDELSHCRVIEIRLSISDFADALFGRGYTPCHVELNTSNVIGMKAENKTELVPFDMYHGRSPELIAKVLKPFEVDGWRAREGDMLNGHCSVQDKGKRYQRVVFFRHVPADSQEAAEQTK